MTLRELRYAEWPKLAGTDLEPFIHTLPSDARILVVEDEHGEIVGHVAVIPFIHAEGWWVREDHRGKAAVTRKLRAGIADLLSSVQITSVFAGAADATVAAMLRKMGAEKLPADIYVLPVGRYTTH